MPEPTSDKNGNKQAAADAAKPGSSQQKGKDGGVPAIKSTPDGIVSLFFSGKSQEIFGCVADTDLTPEHPHKLVPKEKIVEDFKNRAAVCDFFPVKQKVLVNAMYSN